MASFELIGFVRSSVRIGERTLMTIGEYVQGKRGEDGRPVNEYMEYWSVFFPPSSRRHLMRFKSGDQVVVKGTIHMSSDEKYKCAVNGECIKHFYTRNITDEIRRESVSGDGVPDPHGFIEGDF